MILKGVLDTIKRFSVTIYRLNKEDGEYVEGEYVEGREVREAIQAHWQPITGKELEAMPSGERNKEPLKIWTLVEFKESKDDASRLSIEGKIYKVVNVKVWPVGQVNDTVFKYWELVATRSGENENTVDDA